MHFFHSFVAWWQGQSIIELAGVITGLLCVYLAAINNIWNWPLAIISVVLYIFIFYDARLYADMGLQVYFLGTNIYGWYYWSRRPKTAVKVPVAWITRKEIVWSVIAMLVVTPVLGYTLITLAPVLHYQPAAFPYLDSFCTACSIVSQIFLARKVLQTWLIWIFVDVIYVGVYIVKDLQPTAFMYAVYVLIAILGFVDWRKDYKKQIAK
ncbi:nicotinamide riboside transporter PnuC [Mucilaginibacter ginkgonis]|uniref:Nicotinamide riboside transporter PnuC n=1 Tax=Mucilaginibacter ginkgonis TaxID=2682091 RepID=A0A6I4I050_9SPHI|nr:nicotinamide riboside transporter PnuC [Mucilaginibacter ginkgonis]QQL49722.1 nicotinamide mononucleotide transporter [Mucilaginibacter ginkgonis]